MERRAYYRNSSLPWLLIAPQLLLVLVFFYWPTSQALYWAFTLEQPWGGGNSWVGWEFPQYFPRQGILGHRRPQRVLRHLHH